jgi:uncharacterized surface protein with fasciclin (FAS1) repeats
MKTKHWLIALATSLLLVVPFSAGLSQHEEDEFDTPVDLYEPTEEDELLPVLATIREYSSLNTLSRLLKQSGLTDELKKSGPYTLFAPDDSAFKLVPAKTLEELNTDPKALKALLERHILKGKAFLFGDNCNETVESMSGDTIRVMADDDAAYVEHALIIDEEINCSNGVIHVINAVLVP